MAAVGNRARPGAFDRIVHRIPTDLSATDVLTVEFESATADATVIVHDVDACEVYLDPDSGNADADLILQRRGRANSLDLDGVRATVDRTVASMASA